MEPLLQIEGLHFSYGDHEALKNIGLSLQAGRIYSIVGPNGSGKTTLLGTIAKELEHYRGSLRFRGQDLKEIRYAELAKEMAVVRQKNAIQYDFTVADVVSMGRAPYQRRFQAPTKEDDRLVEQALAMTGTDSLRDKSVMALSGGELQRVILARALAQDTQVLLLDEPVSFLDIQQQKLFMDLLQELSRKKYMTVIHTLHDLNLALFYSDDVIVMKQGEIYAAGSTAAVLTEETIWNVYGVRSHMLPHPTSEGKKVMVFL